MRAPTAPSTGRENINGEKTQPAWARQGNRPPPGEKREKPRPKSRAGLKPAWVEGRQERDQRRDGQADKHRRRPPRGAALFCGSVTANTTIARISVPSASAKNAAGWETNRVEPLLGLDRVRPGRACQRTGAGKIFAVAHGRHLAPRQPPRNVFFRFLGAEQRSEKGE